MVGQSPVAPAWTTPVTLLGLVIASAACPQPEASDTAIAARIACEPSEFDMRRPPLGWSEGGRQAEPPSSWAYLVLTSHGYARLLNLL